MSAEFTGSLLQRSWGLEFPNGSDSVGLLSEGAPMSAADVHSAKVTGYDVVRISLGVFLLTAAGLNRRQLAAEPILETSLPKPRWLLLGATQFGFFLLMRPVASVGGESRLAAVCRGSVCLSDISLPSPFFPGASCAYCGNAPVTH